MAERVGNEFEDFEFPRIGDRNAFERARLPQAPALPPQQTSGPATLQLSTSASNPASLTPPGQPVIPPSAPRTQPGPPARSNGGAGPQPFEMFDLSGPLSLDRTTPEQRAFMNAVALATQQGDSDELVRLFGREGTEFGVFQDLSDKFVNSLAHQSIPSVFTDRFTPDISGAQTTQRIQKILAGLGRGDPGEGFGVTQFDGAGSQAAANAGLPGGGTGGGGGAGAGGGAASGGAGFGGGGASGGAGFGGGGAPFFPAPSTFVPGGGGPVFPQLGGGSNVLAQGIENQLASFINGQRAIDPDSVDGGELDALGTAGLRRAIETGGFDPELLDRVTESLQEQLTRIDEQGLAKLEDQLLRRGVTGAGLEGFDTARFIQDSRAETKRNLRDVATQMGLSAADRQLSASTTAAGEGTARRGQSLATRQGNVATVLDAINTSAGRSLGIADVELRNLAENRLFADMIADNNLDVAKFVESTKLARQGNTNSLIGMMLQFAGSLAGGQV